MKEAEEEMRNGELREGATGRRRDGAKEKEVRGE